MAENWLRFLTSSILFLVNIEFYGQIQSLSHSQENVKTETLRGKQKDTPKATIGQFYTTIR